MKRYLYGQHDYGQCVDLATLHILEAENAKLRDALHEILTYAQDSDQRREIARKALNMMRGSLP